MNLEFVKPIRTEEEYESATERMSELVNAPEGSDERNELNLLYDLVEHYEDRHHKIDPPWPHEAIRFRMEQSGLTLEKLASVLGSKLSASELIQGKRPPTLKEVSALSQKLGIPLESLLSLGVYRGKHPVRKSIKRKPVLAAVGKKNWQVKMKGTNKNEFSQPEAHAEKSGTKNIPGRSRQKPPSDLRHKPR